MDSARRKELTAAYKEEKRPKGVFCVRCTTTGQTWVSTSRNLTQQKNGVWFGLKTGGHPNKALQAVWNERGEGAFEFEVLEEIDEDGLTPLGVADRLKAMDRQWRSALTAQALVG
jgi:hypothetical protein